MNKTQLKKIGKGALIAGSGAVLTYFLTVIPSIDFGSYTPLVTAALSILVNTMLKLVEAKDESQV